MSEELTLLKERATAMGISYSPNIGLESLKAKVTEKLNSDGAGAGESSGGVVDTTNQPAPVVVKPEKAAKRELTQAEIENAERAKQHAEQLALVRVRITNLNPVKKDLQGEIFTVANAFIGEVRKYIPYGEATDNGYHIPTILYNELKDRKFVSIKVKKAENGRDVVEQRLVNEFAIEKLPPLTKEELNQLARQQAAAQGLD